MHLKAQTKLLKNWTDAPWVELNSDGSASVTLPEGVVIEQGMAIFPQLVANKYLPLHPQTSISEEGNLLLTSGEITGKSKDKTIIVHDPHICGILKVLPFANLNEDGSIELELSRGEVEYKKKEKTLIIFNEWVAELVPSFISIDTQGEVNIEMPPEITASSGDTIILEDWQLEAFISGDTNQFTIDPDSLKVA